MQRLTLTYAEKRRVFGRDEARHISRFVSEIPEHLLKEASKENEAVVYSIFDEWLVGVENILEREDQTLLLTFDEFINSSGLLLLWRENITLVKFIII